MNVFDLMAKISLDSSAYDSGLRDAERSTESFGDKFASGLEKAVAIGTAALAAAGVAIGKFITDTAALGDEIDKNSQRVGLSYEAYQKWDYAMQISGSSMAENRMAFKALNNKFDEAINGSDTAAESFMRLGISLDDIKGLSREELFEKVIYGLQNVSDESEKAAIANELLGRAGTNLMPLLNSSNEELQELFKTTEEYGFLMSDDMVKASATYQDSLLRMKMTMQGVRNTIMGAFLPELSKFFDKIAEKIKNFMSDEENMKTISAILGAVLKTLGGALKIILKVLGGIAKIAGKFIRWLTSGSKAAEVFKVAIVALAGAIAGLYILKKVLGVIKKVKQAINTLSQVMKFLAANPIVLVIAAIAALVAVLIYLWKHNEKFRKAVKKIWAAITKIFGTAAEVIKKIFEGVVAFFKGVWKAIKAVFNGVKKFFQAVFGGAAKVITTVFGGIVAFFRGIWEGIKKVFNAVKEFFKKVFGGGAGAIKAVFGGIVAFFRGIWAGIKAVFGAVKTFFSTVFRAAVSAVKAVWSGIKGFFSTVWSGIKSVFSGIGGWFKEKFENAKKLAQKAWSGVKGFFSGVYKKVKDAFDGIGDWFYETFHKARELAIKAWDNIKGAFEKIKEEIKKAFKPEDGYEWGKDLMTNFANGASDYSSLVNGVVTDSAGNIHAIVGFSEPDKGPLSDFHTYAPDMMKLFAKGVKDNTGVVTDQVRKSFDFGHLIGNLPTTVGISSAGGYGSFGTEYNQTVNVYSPEALSPSEVARQTKLATRNMVLSMRGV